MHKEQREEWDDWTAYWVFFVLFLSSTMIAFKSGFDEIRKDPSTGALGNIKGVFLHYVHMAYIGCLAFIAIKHL